MVLAESLVVVDTGVLPLDGPWSGEISGRPRGASSVVWSLSVVGRLGSGDGWAAGAGTSLLSLLRSRDVLGKLPAELDGRVGGEGGAWPPSGRACTLLVWTGGCSHRNDD